MAAPHISDDDLELLALDRQPESAARPAEDHLLICAECRERLAGWDEWVRAIQSASRGTATRMRSVCPS
jgi:anti-sigma factor RsiW